MEGVAVQEDFEQIVAAHRLRIYRFALASLRDPDAAETVTQDCFLRAYRNWETFRARLGAQAPRWTALGINWYRAPEIDWQSF